VGPLSNTTFTVEGTDQNGCKGQASVLLKISTCVGVDAHGTAVNFNVYPNPNAGSFVIEGSEMLHLTMINELGQQVKFVQTTGNGQIEISGLSQGVYFLTADTASGPLRARVVVTK
jgi:hypothetical protein